MLEYAPPCHASNSTHKLARATAQLRLPCNVLVVHPRHLRRNHRHVQHICTRRWALQVTCVFKHLCYAIMCPCACKGTCAVCSGGTLFIGVMSVMVQGPACSKPTAPWLCLQLAEQTLTQRTSLFWQLGCCLTSAFKPFASHSRRHAGGQHADRVQAIF
jgi:hypothetical protein